jgi:hypothetical protein
MADTESLGDGWKRWPRHSLAAALRIPTITGPRGLDFASYKQTEAMAAIEPRAIAALETLGVLMTNTYINYQTILTPVRGDTGVVNRARWRRMRRPAPPSITAGTF